MRVRRVAVVGLGLMGGSLARALAALKNTNKN
jgi:prephenate dehydrogenase